MRVAALVAGLAAGVDGQGQGAPLGQNERRVLGALETDGLERWRAASGGESASLFPAEREQLSRLQSRHEPLGALRAGEVGEETVDQLFINVAIVMALVIVL